MQQHQSNRSPSLKAIRSQQLAEKLTLEEGDPHWVGSSTMAEVQEGPHNETVQSKTQGQTLAQRLFGNGNHPRTEPQEEEDYWMALKLQRLYDGQEQMLDTVATNESGSQQEITDETTEDLQQADPAQNGADGEVDDDLALAWYLQEDEQAGAWYRQSRPKQPQGKVRLRTRDENWVDGAFQQVKDLGEEAECAMPEPHNTDIQDLADERDFQKLRNAQYYAVGSGEDTKIMTKHDAGICGRRNAKELEQQFPEMVGDLTLDSPSGGRLSAEGGGERVKIGTRVYNDLKRRLGKSRTLAKGQASGHRVAREEFSTHEGTMDKRTRLLLFKLLNNGYIDSLHGCVKAGKEANVYFAEGWHPTGRGAKDMDSDYSGENEGEESPSDSPNFVDTEENQAEDVTEAELADSAANLTMKDAGNSTEDVHIRPHPMIQISPGSLALVAVKVFRTTLTEFKNRKDYITGDRRFRHINVKKESPRKIINVWVKKEFANLCRIYRAGIPCPQPLMVRKHILLQSFIGSDGWPAPELHEVGRGKANDPGKISEKQWLKIYLQTIRIICALYHRCRLVHADLSERNLLWYDKTVWVIDVAQAVQREHPRADEFLMRDIENITNYFDRRTPINVVSAEKVFSFVKDASVSTDKAVLHRYTKLADRQLLLTKPFGEAGYRFGSKHDPVVKQFKGLMISSSDGIQDSE